MTATLTEASADVAGLADRLAERLAAGVNWLWSQHRLLPVLFASWLVATGAGVAVTWGDDVADPRLVAYVVAGVVVVWARNPLQAVCTAVAALVGAGAGLLIMQVAEWYGVTTLVVESALAILLSMLFYTLTGSHRAPNTATERQTESQ